MIKTSLGLRRKSSVIFGNFPEMFVCPSEQFWKIFGNIRKVVRNLWKVIKNTVCRQNKKKFTLAQRYELYVLVARTISHLFTALTREVIVLAT